MTQRILDIPQIGQKFGRWTVVKNDLSYIYPLTKDSKEKRKNYSKGILVECECKQDSRRIPLTVLYSGVSKGCATCGKKDKFKGCGDLSMSYLNSVMRGAQSRKLEYNLTPEYLWSLFLEQDRRCALSNIEITLDPKFSMNSANNTKKYTQTASLDRIENNKGYIEGNVQWLHKYVNLMKLDFSQEEFIDFCDAISKKHQTKPRVRVLARLSIEGIHRWANCPIEEVSFLKEYHRHVFFIEAQCYVNHSNREIEFIQLAHDIKKYLNEKYFDEKRSCLFFDDRSCEMIAEELVKKFNLYQCEVNEDGEGGAIVKNI